MYQRLQEFAERNSNIHNAVVAYISGFLLTTGWWIMIDSAACYDETSLPHSYYAIGCIATIGFIFLNSIPITMFREMDEQGIGGKLCVFFALLVNFCCLIAAAWVMFASYVTGNITPVWPGVSIFLQTLFIVASSIFYCFGHKVQSSF